MLDDEPDPVTRRRLRSATAIRAGFAMTVMSVDELWLAQFGLGGRLALDEVADILALRREPTAFQHDVLAHALNEWFMDRGVDRPVAYSDDL